NYEPVFPFFASTQGAFRVETADFVTMEDGTGIVHIAPAFGEDDYDLGKERALPVLQPVDERGNFTKEVAPWAGVFVKDADGEIIEDLRKRGLLYRARRVSHSYPFCWRCDSPLIYYARKCWNIKTTEYRDLMIKCNSAVEWHPRDMGVARFANWIEGNVDWALSRDRYWGTPLNVWICESCEKETCAGSVEDLKRLGARLPEELDLHKPFVDDFVLKCEACGGEMRRTPEVIDCWFDSGSMPYAQWHFPFENREKFERSFPADFISEGMDQSRGWFYSLLAISSFVSGVSCFKNVVPIEMILDRTGQRMSKSKGTAVEPTEILAKEGADALRWYLLTTTPLWLPTKFDRAGVTEVASKLLGTLRNTCQFFVLYANIDNFRPSQQKFERSLMDRWIVSRLNSLTRRVSSDIDGYELTRAARTIQDFVIEDLSNWYVRRCRRRFWKAELGPDKLGAYETLYEVLVTLSRLMAPFTPFVSEEVHRKLARAGNPSLPVSVHLCDFPSYNDELVDTALEERMEVILRVTSLGRAARNSARIKTRQPVSRLLVVDTGCPLVEALSQFGELVREELNVKEVSVLPDESGMVELAARPKFEALGPRFGKSVGGIVAALAALGQEKLAVLASGGSIELGTPGGEVTVSPEEVEVTRKEKAGFAVVREGSWLVAVETVISEELRQEGVAREFVHRLQSMRKSADLEVSDRIELRYEARESTLRLLERFREYVVSEALVTILHATTPESGAFGKWMESAVSSGRGAVEEWSLDSEKIKVGLNKAD
ncbi:MAG: class I tRNA ligase family protein, partial [Candidatus Eisenbacteria bacterium]